MIRRCLPRLSYALRGAALKFKGCPAEGRTEKGAPPRDHSRKGHLRTTTNDLAIGLNARMESICGHPSKRKPHLTPLSRDNLGTFRWTPLVDGTTGGLAAKRLLSYDSNPKRRCKAKLVDVTLSPWDHHNNPFGCRRASESRIQMLIYPTSVVPYKLYTLQWCGSFKLLGSFTTASHHPNVPWGGRPISLWKPLRPLV